MAVRFGAESLSQAAPDRAHGAHFSCTTTALLIRKVDELGGAASVEALLRLSGTARTRAYLTDIANWISYDESAALWEAATQVTHRRGLARTVGADAGTHLGGSSVATLLRALGSPEEVYRQLASTVSKYSAIVGVEVGECGPGFAEITHLMVPGFPRSPHHCDWTMGLLSQPPVLFGLPPATVTHDDCAALGASECRYRVSWPIGELPERLGSPAVTARLREELDAMRSRLDGMFETAADLVGHATLDEALARIAVRAAIEIRAPRHLLAVRMTPETEILTHGRGFTDVERRTHAERLLSGEPPPSSWLVVPIRSGVREYGVLAAAHADHGRFLPNEGELLEVYARYAAVAIASATARVEAERRLEQSNTLLDFSRAISAAGTTVEIARRLVRLIPTVVDCDEASVHLWDGERLTGYAIERRRPGSGTASTPRLHTPTAGGSLRRLIENPASDAVFIDGRTATNPADLATFRRFGFAAAILVPLTTRGSLLGTLVVMVGDRPERLRHTTQLAATISGIAAQATVALENGRLLDTVTHQANHDQLTGLANRSLFASEVRSSVQRARTEEQLAGVFYIDLDQFKPINDGFGHDAGDELLTAVAQRLTACTRADVDTVARLGGDEFAVVVTTATRDDLDRIGDRIAAVFDRPFTVEGRRVRIGASIGQAVFPVDADDAQTIVSLADKAMYADKRRRRAERESAPPGPPVFSRFPAPPSR